MLNKNKYRELLNGNISGTLKLKNIFGFWKHCLLYRKTTSLGPLSVSQLIKFDSGNFSQFPLKIWSGELDNILSFQ